MSFDRSSLDSYNDVASRLVEFRAKFPDGSLQPVNPAEPFRIVEVEGKPFLVYAAAAYRTPTDERPGIGVAWEPLPGRTPYTKDSEVMVAETSAWGRAILAVGAADARKGIASAEEVANRHTERQPRGRASAQGEAPDDDAPISRKKVVAIKAGFDDIGMTDAAVQHRAESDVVARTITSTNQLTEGEGTRVLDKIAAAREEQRKAKRDA